MSTTSLPLRLRVGCIDSPDSCTHTHTHTHSIVSLSWLHAQGRLVHLNEGDHMLSHCVIEAADITSDHCSSEHSRNTPPHTV